MKNTLTHIVDYKKTTFDKKYFGKCDMMSLNLKNILEYLKIQETLPSKSRTEYYSCKGIFLCVFFYPQKIDFQDVEE